MIFTIVLSTLVAAMSNVESVPFVGPQNLTAIINDPVGFNCSSMSTNITRLDWFFIKNVGLNDSQYSTGNCVTGQSTAVCIEISSFGEIKKNVTNMYKLDANTRGETKESYLSIPKADMQRAGVYVCNGGYGKMLYSFLNVIDPLPHCSESSSSNKTDEIGIICSFKYYGATANLQWSNEFDSIRNNYCIGEHDKITCAIPKPRISDESCCDVQQCKDEGQKFNSGDMSFVCISGVYQTTENNLGGYSYMFHLDSRPVAFIRCFKSSCEDSSTTTAIALSVTCLVVLLVILMLVLLLRRGARTKAKPAMTTVDEVGKSVPVCTEVKSKEVRKPAPVYTEVKIKGRKKAKSNGSENDTFNNDNATYADVVPPQHIPKRTTETSKTSALPSNQDFDTNNVVYAELGRAPPTFRIVEDRSAPASDGQFDRSEYATIDHTFNAPPPQTNHKQPRK